MRLLFLGHGNYKVGTLQVEGSCLSEFLTLEKLIPLLFGDLGLLEELCITLAVATSFLALANLNKFNFEDQSSIGRN